MRRAPKVSPVMRAATAGRFFEDFTLGEKIAHATPRTLDSGDVALYQALYGGRHILNSSLPAARAAGYADRPLENWLVFHIVFGKTVPDISRNAIANLGYAEGRFLAPVYCGDTLSAVSEVMGLRENSNGKSGIVMVRTRGLNQNHVPIVEYVRWVMVNKRDPSAPAPDPVMPHLADAVAPGDLVPPPENIAALDHTQSGSDRFFDDYAIDSFIDHSDGVTLEDSEHMLATRAYQNTARVHFDGLAQQNTRFGKRLIYGGHIISHARAMSFNGLENALSVAGLNAGTHAAPAFAGDTIYAGTRIVDKAVIAGVAGVGALRIRHFVTKNKPVGDIAARLADADSGSGRPEELLLDLDCWVWMARG